jgi:hypothetical protein
METCSHPQIFNANLDKHSTPKASGMAIFTRRTSVFGGRQGVGKTSWARLQAPGTPVAKKNINKWWDWDVREDVRKVVLEDFPCETGNLLAIHMKVWADRATFLRKMKCGTVAVEPGRFILMVTSNYPMERCFTREEDLKAMRRRFREIEMTNENKQRQRNKIRNQRKRRREPRHTRGMGSKRGR